jgi:hypothetical protein
MKNIAAALIKARQSFPAIHKNKINPHFKSKYASLDSILEAITSPLSDNGLVLIQPTVIKDGAIFLTTQLIHSESGEIIESELIIPPQSDPQKLGSALTYYRRFSICTLLAIAADDDDDGSTATSNSVPNKVASAKPSADIEAARKELRDLTEGLGWDGTKKAEWAKSINPAPFAQWQLTDWQQGISRIKLGGLGSGGK